MPEAYRVWWKNLFNIIFSALGLGLIREGVNVESDAHAAWATAINNKITSLGLHLLLNILMLILQHDATATDEFCNLPGWEEGWSKDGISWRRWPVSKVSLRAAEVVCVHLNR